MTKEAQLSSYSMCLDVSVNHVETEETLLLVKHGDSIR